MQRLLVAVDLLHAQAHAVVAQASTWAASMGATLDLGFVDEYEYSAYLIRDPRVRETVIAQWEKVKANHEAELERLLGSIPAAHRGRVRYLEGKAAPALVEVAPEYDALVVATHGRKGLGHMVLGSVAERLVRMVPVPVVVLRLPAEAPAEEAR